MINKHLFFSLLFLLGMASPAKAQIEGRESNLKAVFIFNFTKYIEWKNHTGENEFVIGIVGKSSIENAITEIAKSNSVNNKRIVIKHFDQPEEITHCHILFIPKNSVYPVSTILERIDKNVLTIGEDDGMSRLGTALNFVLINNKLKFEANLKAINAAGVKVSSQLLKLAIIVN